jgi:fatty acid desaturase
MREKAQDACHQDIPTAHVRDFQMSADFCDETWRYILLPVYLSTYRYMDRTFQVIVNGQNGKISGQKPVEWWKVWAAVAALVLPGLGLGGIGFILLFLGGIGVIPLALGLILFILGAIISVAIVKSAMDSEAD